MKIELKNIKVNLAFSEETNMFRADLYVNGVKVGYAENQGHGGSTDYGANIGKIASITDDNRKAIAAAEAYCKTLPPVTADLGDGKTFTYDMTLEHFIDNIVDEFINTRESGKFFKKAAKHAETAIVFGNKEKMEYRRIAWKDRTIAGLLEIPKGREAIVNAIRKAEADFKEGDSIWNENIPADIWALAHENSSVKQK